jgi:hypothetical protein
MKQDLLAKKAVEDEKERKRRAKEKIRVERELAQKADRKKMRENSRSGGSYALQGSLQGITQNFGTIMQMKASQNMHDNQMRSLQRLYDYRQQTYSSDYTHYQPYYTWNYGFDPNSFNAAPTELANIGGFNYNFSSIPTSYADTYNTSLTNPVTAPITGTSQTGTGFNFGQ